MSLYKSMGGRTTRVRLQRPFIPSLSSSGPPPSAHHHQLLSSFLSQRLLSLVFSPGWNGCVQVTSINPGLHRGGVCFTKLGTCRFILSTQEQNTACFDHHESLQTMSASSPQAESYRQNWEVEGVQEAEGPLWSLLA